MGELSIRRNREIATPRFQKMSKAEKQTGTGSTQAQRPANRTSATVSETMRQLMGRITQVERHIREGRRTLRSGEAALAEIEDSLGRMEELARQAAGTGIMDRAALQKELELLRDEIDRIAQNGAEEGLFQDGDGLDAVVDAVMDALAARQNEIQDLPAWLLRAMTGNAPDRAALMAALGLDDSAGVSDLLAALGKLPLDDSSAAGYLAALYLGAVISGGGTGSAQAAEGLKQLLEMVSDGIPLDQALELLTGGAFTSLEDFQAQFTAGTAPGLDTFLMDLLLSEENGGDGLVSLEAILALLAGSGGGGGMEFDILMGLLSALENTGDGLTEGMANPASSESAANASPPMESSQLGTVQAAGRDLSGAAFDREANTLTVDGASDLILRGQGQEAPVLRLMGPGALTLQGINSAQLAVDSAQARVLTAGENALARLLLGEGATLTLGGGGSLRIGELRGWASGVLRLTGGVVVLEGERGTPAASVVVDGPVSLLAAEGTDVRSTRGEPLTPFDLMLKTLLPEWSSLTSLGVDGQQGQLALREDQMDQVRLWLLPRNSDHREPAHTITLKGRNRAGYPRTHSIYVRWDEGRGSFQEVSMYPNPFTVTGGEQDVDWSYDEPSHTLRILTGRVTAVSGGAGTDANLAPFSGRIALADGIGRIELTLEGVECRVTSGRAFHLGRGNEVTLLLRRGTDNVFESGAGFAGISLGDGTSLRIDQTKGGRGDPEGTLTATAGSGGAGIGRDSGVGRERTGPIHIRGGVVTATGTGGGAGIGGALGAPVGDIRIQGGTVTAQASCSAAAIGAGIQGACGDIVITGSAHIVKAQGGGPDGDIGGCMFGNCGKVQVSAGTDIGDARLWTRQGLSLQMGESSVTLPKFRVSARALGLDELDVSTREAARAAMEVITSDRRWVTRLQGAYGAMYGQLAQSFGGMYSVHQHFSVVRDSNEASSLVYDIREVLRLSPLATFLSQRGMEDVSQLLR